MIDSNDLIHQANDQDTDQLRRVIDNMHDEDLQATAQNLGISVRPGATTDEYLNAFGHESWKNVTRSMEDVRHENYEHMG